MASISTDLEKGLTSTTTRPVQSLSSSTGDAIITKGSSQLTPVQLFQVLVGIHTPPSLTQDGCDVGRKTDSKSQRDRTDDNKGLYQRAKEQERTARIAYKTTSFISNTLYMLQIILAATFTALSSYKDSAPVTLTVLGAINTVIAGCLAWQKGQGVPQRYRKAQDQYQALIFDIEMTERSFLEFEATGGESATQLDPRKEKDRLQKLYDTARADQQANYPDLYVSTGAHSQKDTSDSTK